MKVLLRASFALAFVAAVAGRAAAQVPAADPQAIYESARSAWAYTSYPRYAQYAVSVRYRSGEKNVVRHYDTLEDLRRGIVFPHAFSREETANPSFPPGGVNIGILGATLNEPQSDDPIGPLALAVTYDFGLSRSPVTTQVAQMGSEITAPSRLQVIGRSGMSVRTYAVRLIEMLDNGKTYHLGLTPLRDAKHFRLRELWVTAGTFVTQRALVAGNFARSPYTEVGWLISFTQIDGGPYIASERAQGPLDFGDAGSLEDVTIAFEELKSTNALPPYGTVGINGGTPEFVTEP